MRACLTHVLAAAGHLALSYPYFVVAAPAVVLMAVACFHREESEWDCVYVNAARHLRQGKDIYTDGYSYPPFAAFTALPASFLSPTLVRATWLAGFLLGLAIVARGGWRLAGGHTLQGRRPVRPGAHVAAVLGFLSGAAYLQNSFAHQQNDLVIGAFLVGGCLLLRRTHSLGAATCFGLAAALKCTAMLWVSYLLWRGRPGAAAWLVFVAVGVNLLPNLVSPAPSGRLWCEEFAYRFLRPMAARRYVAGTWASSVIYNQSIAGSAQRWLVGEHQHPVGPLTLREVVLAADAALLVAALLVCRSPFRRLQANGVRGMDRETVEYAVVLMLMLLLSPMSSKAHFGILIVPGFLLARAAVASGSRFLWGCLLASVSLALVSNKDVVGDAVYSLTLEYGTVMWHTVILLVGCLTYLWRQTRVGGQFVRGPAEVPAA
jgi:hypothetical protein